MTPDTGLAERLLPALPGWVAGPASLTRGEVVDLLLRTYERGRVRVFVEVTAGPSAAAVVAQTMSFPPGESVEGRIGARTWMLRGRRAHLVTDRGAVHSLGVVLRGGPGDLPGSVRLDVHGHGLRPDDAIEMALALDWDAITAALAGGHPYDPDRVAAASRPPPVPTSSPHASLLWPMLPSLASMEGVARLERRRPPRFAIVNGHAIAAALPPAEAGIPPPGTADHDPLRFAAIPTPVLVIGQPGFAPDYIWAGLHFASARLRDALGLGPEAIEYRDVDTSGSVPAARAADYRMFRVVHDADPVDLAAMHGHEPDRAADGSPTLAWLLSVTGPHATPRRTVWRAGFVPPAPLFRDRTGRLIATDALAGRVMRAGLADVVFQDVTSEAALHGLAFRPGPTDGAS